MFVMDIYNSAVVHAVKGERAAYKPVHTFSHICHSSAPGEVVACIRPREVYVADLNQLQGRGNNFSAIEGLHPSMMLDIGASTMRDVEIGLELSQKVVLGSETAPLGLIEQACDFLHSSTEALAVSIDCRGGELLCPEPMEVVEFARALSGVDVSDVLLLNLTKVGTGSGIDDELVLSVMDALDRKVLYGGGVASMEHIDHLDELGAGGALVATAVHTGAVPVSVLR